MQLEMQSRCQAHSSGHWCAAGMVFANHVRETICAALIPVFDRAICCKHIQRNVELMQRLVSDSPHGAKRQHRDSCRLRRIRSVFDINHLPKPLRRGMFQYSMRLTAGESRCCFISWHTRFDLFNLIIPRVF